MGCKKKNIQAKKQLIVLSIFFRNNVREPKNGKRHPLML